MSLFPSYPPTKNQWNFAALTSWHPHLLGANRIVPGWLGTGAKLGAKATEAPGGAAEGGAFSQVIQRALFIP